MSYTYSNNPVLGPAKALHEIDQIIGNQSTITEEELGRVRGIVLTSLQKWHAMYPDVPCHRKVEIDPETEVRVRT